jgi:hypothetical protein
MVDKQNIEFSYHVIPRHVKYAAGLRYTLILYRAVVTFMLPTLATDSAFHSESLGGPRRSWEDNIKMDLRGKRV